MEGNDNNVEKSVTTNSEATSDGEENIDSSEVMKVAKYVRSKELFTPYSISGYDGIDIDIDVELENSWTKKWGT